MARIYADNAATTKMSETAKNTLLRCLEEDWANPSSLHTSGQIAAERLRQARQTIAACLNARPEEILFTSGGSEADNQALISLAAAGAKKEHRHIVSSRFEHHAVLHTLDRLKKQGFEVTLLDVHRDGVVRPEELKAAQRPDTAFVTIMAANNEIGTLQPLEELGAVCRERGVPFHTDAVQAAGHIPLDVAAQHIDALSLSAHKFRGPKGVGALYMRRGLPLLPLIEGGAQERGKRAGTENVPAIAAMAAALEESCAHQGENARRVSALRDRLARELSRIPHSVVNGGESARLPGIVNLCFEGIEGESLLLLLDAKGIAASSGSACTSGSLDPSHVLLALGLPHEVAHGSLRLSLNEDNTEAEVDAILAAVPPVVAYLRDISPVWEALEKGERPYVIQ